MSSPSTSSVLSPRYLAQVLTILVSWWRRYGRDPVLPWRRERDPYRVLIAEILLRRTRGGKVVKVYELFLQKFPTVRDLAEASVEEIEEVLQPLGLQRRRAQELKNMALILWREYGGSVPRRYEELVRLPGVGDYIARAVRCFAYGEPEVLVDVNVCRVFSRILSRELSVVRRSDVEFLRSLLERAVSYTYLPHEFVNKAVLDHAAVTCRARSPRCSVCPVRNLCLTYRTSVPRT